MVRIRFLFIAIFIFFFFIFLTEGVYSQQFYWDEPRVLIGDKVRFPQSASGDGLIVLAWQEYESGKIYLSLQVSEDLISWEKNLRFTGPFFYEGKEVRIFDLLIDNQGRIIIAVSSSDDQITMLLSEDKGKTFTESYIASDVTIVSPKLFLKSKGDILLFVSNDEEDALSLYHTTLNMDFLRKPQLAYLFKPFLESKKFVITFLPHHTSFMGREYVVYQSQDRTKEEQFQLYLKISDNSGSFSLRDTPILLTKYEEEVNNRQEQSKNFDNQRPFIAAINDRLVLVWERAYRSINPQIYYGELDGSGNWITEDVVLLPYEMITKNKQSCFFPQIFTYRERTFVTWFDNRQGDNLHIIIAEKLGGLWQEKDLCRDLPGVSINPKYIVEGGLLGIFWGNQYGGKSRLISIAPDQYVEPPKISPLNFVLNRPNQSDTVKVNWNIPNDASGIVGYSYSWTKVPVPSVPQIVMLNADRTSLTIEADTDGEWYFHLSARDNAGNWSSVSTIKYIHDTKPPGTVTFKRLEIDEEGFAVSNTLNLAWYKPAGEEIGGYTFVLKKIDSDFSGKVPYDITLTGLPQYVMTQNTIKDYSNIDNGIWAFGVAAIDIAGNIGDIKEIVFKTNKYIPVTQIYDFITDQDELGRIKCRILGRDFLEEGPVTTVFLDRDKLKPYDYTFSLEKGDFTIINNGYISGPVLDDIDEATYYLGLIHIKRGVTIYSEARYLEPFGTLVTNPGSLGPTWLEKQNIWFSFNINYLIMGMVLFLLAFAVLVSVRRLFVLTREANAIKLEVLSLLKKEPTLKQRKEIMKQLKTMGMGLRVKFTLLMTILVILIVLMVSIPLSYNMIETQTRNLADGLYQRSKVMLGSISSGAEELLLDQAIIELEYLTNQITAMTEVKYAIITGITPFGSSVPAQDMEYVWAVSDEEALTDKIQEEYLPGQTVLSDEVSGELNKLTTEINKNVLEDLEPVITTLEEIIEESAEYYGRTDEFAIMKREELGLARADLEVRIVNSLREISHKVYSIPKFELNNLKPEYTFFMPIVYRVRGQDIFFRGLVRLGVSAEGIIREIEATRNNLIVTIGIIAFIAVGLGFFGALILASITISPIRRLVRGVEVIRDTEDKEKLKNHSISIKQRDEIRILADTVNQMTQGLVQAAIANKELIVGKEVQKMFIPLQKNKQGTKGSTGGEKTEKVEIFGYYEGAKGVSGDYFDYIKLDNKHYAFIKCDIAGKGVSAALIMVEVATLFLSYFRKWTIKNPGLKIDTLVYTINDMIEERGFKGRFAALTIAIINVETGNAIFCNAGDTLVHYFDSSVRKMVQIELPKAPAAGVFSSDILEMQSGFKQVKKQFKAGDVLFLFTDGIDESQRKFRDENFNLIRCTEESLADGESHGGTHPKGGEFEELSIPRIHNIINAVFNKRVYRLEKYHSPTPEEELTFDFSSCEGTVKEAVLALISVEKIFRLYQDPSATKEDVIYVDKTIDKFLQDIFLQYSLYFNNKIPVKDDEEDHVRFSHLKEDSQYDDLTIIGLRKL